jgi:hypothetical protein
MKRWWPVLCLISLHSPDGKVLHIDSNHIVAMRAAEGVKQHLAIGTETIVYMSGQNFGVKETPEQIEELVASCVEEKGQ